ncbi:MurR/RpiR family transcriptional regulator [Brevibacillus ruminantium]|uniref:MurR/RpiR family transcriptional regulator n=1 Tax=Brevibacillus ruminantium TaxID=2950604 RepID=A0ABY4WA64_9BACL|nr:MurR/RpiR family transcriptional regulator [Brevibacillus ruminantium]USG64086.1 MurR/RpiR family transcriptional regulator [Brevibacillus ruminantium]
MQTSTTFEELVKEKFSGLSTAQKKVAEHVISHLEKAAFSTAVQLGREVEVSETTVIRLSYALGFSSFSEMQDRIQQQFLQSTSHSYAKNLPENTTTSEETNPFAQVFENDIFILQQTLKQMNVEDIWKTAEAMIKADHVLVVGNRASFSAAHWFAFTLGNLRKNVHLCPFSGDNYEKLFNLGEQSVTLAISFPRYSKGTLQIAESAKKRGATLISVTDRVLSPVGLISDITLTTEAKFVLHTGIDTMSSVISLLHAVILGVMMKDPDGVRARLHGLEQFYANHDVFVE